jgi:hypothetical protein
MKNVMRALSYLSNYLPIAVGGGISMLLVNIANLLTPQLLRVLVDQGITPLVSLWSGVSSTSCKAIGLRSLPRG